MASLCDGAGTCTGGAPIPIDDGIACTLDTCDPVTGAKHRPCATIDRSVATSVHKALEWLHTGPDPIQTGVAPGTIEPRRAAGVSGTVTDAAGNPLPNVTITVHSHPELGQTVTRADGAFDIAVNGGGQLTFTLKKPGYLDAQRTKMVEWTETTALDPIILLKPDPAAGAPRYGPSAAPATASDSYRAADSAEQVVLLVQLKARKRAACAAKRSAKVREQRRERLVLRAIRRQAPPAQPRSQRGLCLREAPPQSVAARQGQCAFDYRSPGGFARHP
jgi:hypothetical protein